MSSDNCSLKQEIVNNGSNATLKTVKCVFRFILAIALSFSRTRQLDNNDSSRFKSTSLK